MINTQPRRRWTKRAAVGIAAAAAIGGGSLLAPSTSAAPAPELAIPGAAEGAEDYSVGQEDAADSSAVEAPAAGCTAWRNVTGRTYSTRDDASIRLQTKTCRDPGDISMRYIRTSVCNFKANGKDYWSIAIFRNSGHDLYHTSGKFDGPPAGSCRGRPVGGKAVHPGQNYNGVLSLSYQNTSGVEAVYTVTWEY